MIPLCCCLFLAVRWALAGIGTLIIEAVTDSSMTIAPEGKSARLIIPLQRHYTDDINQLCAVMLSPLSVLAHQSVSLSSFLSLAIRFQGNRGDDGCTSAADYRVHFTRRVGRTPFAIASGHNALSCHLMKLVFRLYGLNCRVASR